MCGARMAGWHTAHEPGRRSKRCTTKGEFKGRVAKINGGP
jgi:hypothetical protein